MRRDAEISLRVNAPVYICDHCGREVEASVYQATAPMRAGILRTSELMEASGSAAFDEQPDGSRHSWESFHGLDLCSRCIPLVCAFIRNAEFDEALASLDERE